MRIETKNRPTTLRIIVFLHAFLFNGKPQATVFPFSPKTDDAVAYGLPLNDSGCGRRLRVKQ